MTERERFEAWALKKLAKGDEKVCDPMMQRDELGHYVSFIAQGAWEAWREQCPDEWQCVPVEPTAEMVDAASDAYMPFGDMALAIQAAIAYAPEDNQ